MNFNYTGVAENCTNRILYVHGPIKENQIVLGYDPPDPFCLAPYENRRWLKDLCRERLSFLRYSRQALNLSFTDADSRDLLDEFEQIQAVKNSGKGLEAEDIRRQKHSDLFIEYFSREHGADTFSISDETLAQIRRIVVLGHSLKSDETFLKRTLERCSNLREVVLFSYKGEEDAQWEEKKHFFDSYSVPVKKEPY